VLPAVFLLWTGGAVALWSLEKGVNSQLHSFGDALWWSVVTITTVGYGDITPVTPEGRIVGGALAVVGLGLIGYLSSQLTLLWIGQEEAAVDATAAEVAALRQELEELRRLLPERLPPQS
jgi:voltage-gated potassium channel